MVFKGEAFWDVKYFASVLFVVICCIFDLKNGVVCIVQKLYSCVLHQDYLKRALFRSTIDGGLKTGRCKSF